MGGQAFENTVPIGQKQAELLVKDLRKRTGWDLEPVGSFGKKAVLGDLDLIVTFDQYNQSMLMSLFEEHKVLRRVFCTCKVPIPGTNDFAQVDFFGVSSLEWGRFAYASEGGDSGKRVQLLRAITFTHEEPGFDYLEWEGTELMVRAGRTFDQARGIRRIFQHRKGKRVKALKNLKTEDKLDFQDLFPNLRLQDPPPINDPAKAREMLFGDADADCSTFDSIWAIVTERFLLERQQRILAQMEKRGFN